MINTATKSPIQILRDAVEAARAYHGITLASMPPQDAWVYHRVSERLTEALRLTEGAQDAPGEAVADNRRCKPCAATRGGAHCWKCGAETFDPSPLAGDDPRLPPIDRIRELAREVGYAIGVHGSQQRDLDIIAAPWTDGAIGNHALLQHIAAGLTTDNGPAHIISTERKPLGRYAATIQMDGWYKQLDISVCPNSQYESLRHPAPTPTAEVLAPKAISEPSPDCTRSHPHENMDAACEAKTVQARADYKRAGVEHAKRAEGEREAFEATFDPFEFRCDYDKYGPSEAAFAVWQARGQQRVGAPDGWVSVDARLPEVGAMVLVYAPNGPHDYPDDIRISFDCTDPDDDEATSWLSHNGHYEHYCCVAKPEGSVGPSEKAPYTHWMPIPAAPKATP